ncbi:mannose-1-phosphate guanylyltransferase [Propioniciclava flava]|uniref:Mannose-1-phosphate guanylyltransferase n=1 Tax=Propioniciclava flava TaxID=2072026 RepID=A0A4Q2EF15_9ACTN|nr:sugar phosphate nucleotidyltransferase [Propioniciclava flava]RXW31831.1 mannose-1-phosphate guanylyltransferase [Propioniciclava flava]
MRYVVIMAGGSGTRLWPLSRKGTPKQLLKLIEGRSLLRLAFERARRLVPDERIVVVTGAPYLDQVAADLPELPPENLLGEPEGRDSLNAVAWPAAVLAHRDPEAIIAQLTADQLIDPVDAFVAALEEAFSLAEADDRALVTLGVIPTNPHTGYGYLHRGAAVPGFPTACRVQEFREKPDAQTAAAYLASGEFWWNAGMFVWRARTVLAQIEALEPDTYAVVEELAEHPERLGELFGTLRKTSVDFAIMEPVSRGATDAHVVAVALPIRWRDVGGFASLAEVLTADGEGNVVDGDGVLLDAEGNLVINSVPGHVVTLSGVSDMVVVHTVDATMVTTLAGAENVKALVARVADQAGACYV